MEKILKKRSEFLNNVSAKWQKSNLKALIAPVLPHTVFLKESNFEQSAMVEYTQIWSSLGYPCGTMPITKVEEEEQTFRDHFADAWTETIN